MHQQPEKDREEGFFNMSIPNYKPRNYVFDLFRGEGLGLTQNHVTAPGARFPCRKHTSFPRPCLLPMSIGLGLHILAG